MNRLHFSGLIAAVCALILCPANGQAGVLYTYNGTTQGLTLVGNANTASTSDGTVLRITPGLIGQSGAVYSTTAVPLGTGGTFSTQFQFRFTGQGGIDPADGIVFVLATNTTGLGQAGGGLGYQGTNGNSVGIEFDTYENGGADSSSNHVAIDTNGVLTDTALVNVYGIAHCDFDNGYTEPGCMSNGDLWTVNISYNGTNLTVTLSDPREGTTFTALNNYPINIASILGQNTAYVGFSASTGSGFENHDIVTWTFANTVQISGVPTVPALSRWALGMVTVLLVVIAFLMFRRKDTSPAV
jgi:hypothetical protein